MINLNISKKVFTPTFFPMLFNYENRYEVYYGGAGSGKSVFVAQKLILKALKEKRKVLCCRKVGASLADSVFQNLKEVLSKLKLTSYCSFNRTTLTITLPNGSVFLCKGLDDSEKIKSIVGITDIWMEEATEFSSEDFSQLDLRLRASSPNLQLFLSFNPISKANWCYKHWFEHGTPPNAIVLKSTYLDNPFLPQSYIDAIEHTKITNPTYYSIYALGEFCSLDKLIYYNWRIGNDEVPKEAKIMVGLDFGYVNDPSALIVSYLDEATNTIYIVNEKYEKGLLNNQIADLIKYMGLSKEIIIADSAEQKSIEEIKRLGIPRIRSAVKGQGSVLQGIQKLQQYTIVVNPKCVNTIIELQNYSWKKDKKTDEYINEPQDDFNHALDALRYSIQSIDKGRLKTMDKKLLGL